jgi:hypothetical protein
MSDPSPVREALQVARGLLLVTVGALKVAGAAPAAL